MIVPRLRHNPFAAAVNPSKTKKKTPKVVQSTRQTAIKVVEARISSSHAGFVTVLLLARM
jgi:hypothetical protein